MRTSKRPQQASAACAVHGRQHQRIGLRRQPGVGVQKQQGIGQCTRSTGIHLQRTTARRIHHGVDPGPSQRPRSVAAAAIDEHQFDATHAQRLQGLQRGLDTRGFVQRRNDDRQGRLHRTSFSAQS